MSEAPEFPFFVETPGIECWVLHLPDDLIETPLDEAWASWVDGEPQIQMRVYDERVLLHEVMHVAFKRARPVISEWIDAGKASGNGDVFAAEEGIVRVLTAALWSMGWRWERGSGQRAAEAVERDFQRAIDARERIMASVRDAAHAGHMMDVHPLPLEVCREGVCGVYWKAVEAARQ